MLPIPFASVTDPCIEKSSVSKREMYWVLNIPRGYLSTITTDQCMTRFLVIMSCSNRDATEHLKMIRRLAS